jgi:DNA-binding transcriptional ArsR family regulator
VLASASGRSSSRQLGNCLTVRRLVGILKHVPNQRSALDQVFKALADGTRRDMVERLIRGPASVGELAQPLAMSLPAVMQHLQVLEACGLVRSEKVGRVRTCHIEPAGLRMAEDWIGRQGTTWEHRLDRLGEFLTEDPGTSETPGSDKGEQS